MTVGGVNVKEGKEKSLEEKIDVGVEATVVEYNQNPALWRNNLKSIMSPLFLAAV